MKDEPQVQTVPVVKVEKIAKQPGMRPQNSLKCEPKEKQKPGRKPHNSQSVIAEDSWQGADDGEDVSSKHGGDHDGVKGKIGSTSSRVASPRSREVSDGEGADSCGTLAPDPEADCGKCQSDATGTHFGAHTRAVRGTMRFRVLRRERRGGAGRRAYCGGASLPDFERDSPVQQVWPTQTSATAGCGCANAANYGRNRRVGCGPKRTRATTD